MKPDEIPLLDWQPGTMTPSLSTNALHLWRIDADMALPDLYAWGERLLSAAELERARRLRLPKLRRRFVLSHLACRQILGAYLDCKPQAIEFVYSDTGKPGLGAPAGGLEFNLSTSGDLTLLGLRLGAPLGVDAELTRRRIELLGIAERMFNPACRERLRQLQGEEQRWAFYAEWTALEARVKRDGRGLAGHRAADGPEILVAHARPRADAICAIAGYQLPATRDWVARRWLSWMLQAGG
jgi:4'-phosphopantetheinyl transferase